MKQSIGYARKNPDGTWRARITFTDRTTRRRVNKKKGFPPSNGLTKTEADDWLAEQRRKIRKGSAATQRMTFAKLLDHCIANHFTEPRWKDDKLVSGMRSFEDTRQRANIVAEYLGPRDLRSIRYDDLRKLRLLLLDRKARRKSKDNEVVETTEPLSIGTVNRILSICRRMFSLAVRQGWMDENPFTRGEPLIKSGDETARERILTPAEEKRLLAACEEYVDRGDAPKGQRWLHIRPVIILALDTGMRLGEIMRLRWKDVDLDEGLIIVIAAHTKTLKARYVGMTPRIVSELRKLQKHSQGERVFGEVTSVEKAWRAVRSAAGLEGLRLHDLRHTLATRMINRGVALTNVGKVLGHTQAQTTLRYINPEKQMAKKAAKQLSGGAKRGNPKKSYTSEEKVN